MKTNQMPKTIRRWLDRNRALWTEAYMDADPGFGNNGDYGVWVHLAKGYRIAGEEVHTIHEDNVKDFMWSVSEIEKCPSDCSCK